jgi:hypothetical protein
MPHRANRTSFRRGPDRRRHVFTAEERSRGGQTTWRKAMEEQPWLLAWLQRRIDHTAHPATLAAYRQRRRGHEPEEA